MKSELLPQNMKAYVLRNIGKLGMEDVPRPVPGEKEVLVSVKAAGICGSDIPRIYQTGTYSYPLIPGHEFAGVVAETGRSVDSFWLGKRVGVFPLIPCGQCRSCVDRQYELCRHYGYLGSRTAGGFAEYVNVPEWNLIELPDNVAFEQAAMLEPMAVAVHAMRRADILPDSTVAVCGLGTIGQLLSMFLTEAGVRSLLLIGNKPYQSKIVSDLGLNENCYCDSSRTDAGSWIEERTGGNGADVFFDCVGRNEVLELAVEHTVGGGTVMLVGNPASHMELGRQTYWKILRNQLTVRGTWNSSFLHEPADDWHFALDRVERGVLHPELLITQRFGMDGLMGGFELMRDKRESFVKVMMIC